jgi:hypothetical protein
LAFPFAPPLPLFPPHGFPLPFAHGSPGGTLPLALAPEFPFAGAGALEFPPEAEFAPPRPGLVEAAASTIVPPSTRAVSAERTRLPATTTRAACEDGLAAEAHWAGVTFAATSNEPWFTTTSCAGGDDKFPVPVPATATADAPFDCEGGVTPLSGLPPAPALAPGPESAEAPLGGGSPPGDEAAVDEEEAGGCEPPPCAGLFPPPEAELDCGLLGGG